MLQQQFELRRPFAQRSAVTGDLLAQRVDCALFPVGGKLRAQLFRQRLNGPNDFRHEISVQAPADAEHIPFPQSIRHDHDLSIGGSFRLDRVPQLLELFR